MGSLKASALVAPMLGRERVNRKILYIIFLKANELVLPGKNVNRKKSVQIDAVPFELPLEKNNEGERNVKANGMICAQELSGNSA